MGRCLQQGPHGGDCQASLGLRSPWTEGGPASCGRCPFGGRGRPEASHQWWRPEPSERGWSQALVSGLAARPRREPIPAAPIHPAGGTWFWQPQDPKAVVKSPDWVRPPGGDEHAPPQAGETGAWRGSSSQRQESRAGDASHAGAAGGPGGGGSRAHAADTARRGAGPGRPGRDRTRRVEGHGSKTTSVSVSWHAGPLTNLAVLGKHPGLPVNDDALRKTRP